MSLLDALSVLFHSDAEVTAEVRAAIERAAATVDPRLRSFAAGQVHRLAGPAQRSLEYCARLAAAIPGPIEIGRRAFAANPLVHALFGTAEDVERTLGECEAVRRFVAEAAPSAAGSFYALLGLRHREKRVLGMALQGETVQAEVPQTLLYFEDHSIAEPAAELADLRQRLARSMFDGLVKGFAVHVEDLRQERASLREAHGLERAESGRASAVDHAVHTRRMREVEARLREAADTLSPEHLLECLGGCLSAPEQFLRLDPVTVTVDRMGVVVTGEDRPADAQTLTFPELTSRDRRRWVVLLVEIGSEEARAAVEQQTARRQRYIVI